MSTTTESPSLSPLRKPLHPATSRRVLVLAGGGSTEHDVSLLSGAAVAEALTALGHAVERLDQPLHLLALITHINNAFQGAGPEVVFNVIHGGPGENGIFQGVLSLLNIPHTFSGVLTGALTVNKAACRHFVTAHGVLCPEGRVVAATKYLEDVTSFPHIVKPLSEGCSIGVRLVSNPVEQRQVADQWAHGNEILVEKYIPGRELTVTVLGGVAVGVLEVLFDEALFSDEDRARKLVPAPIHPDAYKQAMKMAEIAHKALGCRGVSRSDIRYDDTLGEPGVLYYLETNMQPGFTSTSLVQKTVEAIWGWTYQDLVQWVLEDAFGPR